MKLRAWVVRHNHTLSCTAHEVAKFYHKLHDVYSSVLWPALLIKSSVLPQPVKCKSVILSMLSHLTCLQASQQGLMAMHATPL